MCVLVDEIRELVYERDCDRPFTVDAVELDAGSGGEQSVSVLPGRHAGRLEQVGCVVVVERIFARRVPVIQRRALEAVQAEALFGSQEEEDNEGEHRTMHLPLPPRRARPCEKRQMEINV